MLREREIILRIMEGKEGFQINTLHSVQRTGEVSELGKSMTEELHAGGGLNPHTREDAQRRRLSKKNKRKEDQHSCRYTKIHYSSYQR